MTANIPWPTKNDKAFKEGLALKPSVASMNWLSTWLHESLFPNAYKEGADIIVSYIEEGRLHSHPDLFFFPIAYLYRHTFELSLKHLIQQGIELEILTADDNLERLLHCHNLHALWHKVRFILTKVWSEGDQDDLRNVERIIQEFHNLDSSGQQFRYAKDRSGNPTTERLPANIDLSELKRVCNNLFSFFEACDAGLSHYIELKQNIESDY
jgi:hypothetical protein